MCGSDLSFSQAAEVSENINIHNRGGGGRAGGVAHIDGITREGCVLTDCYSSLMKGVVYDSAPTNAIIIRGN